MSAMTERQADMAGDAHGDKTQEEPQAQEDLGQQQAAQDRPQMSGTDWEKAVAERDERIAELKAQGESDRIDSKLQLAGVRNVKAARAMLSDYDGDADALVCGSLKSNTLARPF